MLIKYGMKGCMIKFLMFIVEGATYCGLKYPWAGCDPWWGLGNWGPCSSVQWFYERLGWSQDRCFETPCRFSQGIVIHLDCRSVAVSLFHSPFFCVICYSGRLHAVVFLQGPFVSCAYFPSCRKVKFSVFFSPLAVQLNGFRQDRFPILRDCWSNIAICKVLEQYEEGQSVGLVTAIFTEGLAVLEIDIILYENHGIDIHTYCRRN